MRLFLESYHGLLEKNFLLDSIWELHQLNARGQPAVCKWRERNNEHLFLWEQVEYEITFCIHMGLL